MAKDITEKLKDVARAAAPAIGSYLGGPLGGMALRKLSEYFLGKADGDEEEVFQAINSATPEQLVELRKIDAELKKQLIEAGIKEQELVNADRLSARNRQVAAKDLMPGLLAIIIVTSFVLLVWRIVTGSIEGLNDPVKAGLIGSVIGYLSAKAEQVVAYYFGSSAGSKQKNGIIDNMLQDREETRSGQ